MQSQSPSLAERVHNRPAGRLESLSDVSERLARHGHRCLVEPTPAQFVRRVIRARTARRRFFKSDLFADPAWDMLLELYALRCEQRRTSVSKLAMAANVPGTTALRWLDKLEDDGLLVRQGDPLDARRVWVSLSDAGVAAMESYLEQLPICTCDSEASSR